SFVFFSALTVLIFIVKKRRKNEKILLIVLVCLLTVNISQAIAQDEWHGSVNLMYGIRTMNDDWKEDDPDITIDLTDHTVFGIDADFGKKAWPVNMYIGFSSSKADETISVDPDIIFDTGLSETISVKEEATISEFDIGAKAIWNRGSVRPFLSIGLAFLDAEIETTAEDFPISVIIDDTTTGVFLSGGASYLFGDFGIGAEIRTVVGSDFGDFEMNGDYFQFGVLAGWYF
ncbi:MAG: hypothetical protein ACE5EA_11455, partial [Nitrospirota bacterium]